METAADQTVPADASAGDAKLAQVRGKDYPPQSAPPLVKAKWIDQLYATGETDALHRYKQGTKNILYANGRQWISWVKSRNSWEDQPVAADDFRVTSNYILVLLRARVQRLMSSEIHWRGIPDSNSYEDRDHMKAAVNLIESRYRTLEMSHRVRQGVMQAGMTGLVVLKSFWNPSIGPLTPATLQFAVPAVNPETGESLSDESGQPVPSGQTQEHFVDATGQPVADESQAFMYRPGDTDTALRTIFNLRVNPEAMGWTEAEGLRWLIDSDIVPLEVAKERFQKIADQIKPMGGSESAMTYERIAQGSATQREFGQFAHSPYTGGTKAQDQSKYTTIREYWEMRSPFFPKGRLMVNVGGAIAYDGEWPQGVFPYAPIYGEPAVMSCYGRPPVNDWIPLQNVINRELTATARSAWKDGTNKFVAWAIPGVPDQLSQNDDEIVQIPMRGVLGNRSINDVFQRIPPAQVSSDRWRLIDQGKSTIFDVGAYHEVSRGQIPPGLDSGVAIQYLLESESAQIKDAVDSLKRAMITWGRHQIAIAKWGYGTDGQRWIPVHRADLGYQVESVKGLDLPDPETMGLDIEYFRPTSEAATRAEVKEFLAEGYIDPRRAMQILDSGLGYSQAFDSQTRHYAKAKQENLDFQRGAFQMETVQEGVGPAGQPILQTVAIHADGSPFLLPQDDDGAIHLDVHHEIALDNSQPWTLRQVVLQHIAEHRAAAQQAMAASQPMPAPAGEEGGAQDPAALAQLQQSTQVHAARQSAAQIS